MKKRNLKDQDLDKISGGAEVFERDPDAAGRMPRVQPPKGTVPGEPPIGGSQGVEQESGNDPLGGGDDAGTFNKG